MPSLGLLPWGTSTMPTLAAALQGGPMLEGPCSVPAGGLGAKG